jgi:hypothetical protein
MNVLHVRKVGIVQSNSEGVNDLHERYFVFNQYGSSTISFKLQIQLQMS